MKTKEKYLQELRLEAHRVLERISEAEAELKQQWPSNKGWAAVKRATLEFNRVAVEIRKGRNL